jgi:uncharacterized cupredoxin-like copper-binding protein
LTVLADGPRFQPQDVSAKAGTIVFLLNNVPKSSTLMPDHNMLIGSCVSFYGDGSIRAGELLAGTPHVLPNETVAFTVNGLAPGSYVFWCSVNVPDGGTHGAAGMVGTLTITP